MVYTSISHQNKNAIYTLRIAHLYGDLMNTYGDNGNILMLYYLAKQIGASVTVDIVSLGDVFDPTAYDIAFFGGGQDREQSVIAIDLPLKHSGLLDFIENDGVLLAICGGFQLLGKYYTTANGDQIPGLGIFDHYTVRQDDKRFIGNVRIHNDIFDEDYYGFENHQGRTFLSDTQQPLGRVLEGFGNNGDDGLEGLQYKNTFASYFHGPILARNSHLAYHLLQIALTNRYGPITLPALSEIMRNR